MNGSGSASDLHVTTGGGGGGGVVNKAQEPTRGDSNKQQQQQKTTAPDNNIVVGESARVSYTIYSSRFQDNWHTHRASKGGGASCKL